MSGTTETYTESINFDDEQQEISCKFIEFI
jgi:hypothetical protein